ncbi:hypothetical protein C1646_668499, partial [Rhizophagus diaphanus]
LFLYNKIKTFDKYNEYGINPTEIDIKKCVKYVACVWDNITQSTIENCWLKADILPKDDENEIDIGANTQIYSTHMKELEKVQALIDELNFENQINAKEFIHYDDSEITIEMYSNKEILKAVLPNNQEKEIEEPLDPLPSVTHNEIIESYEKVILYLE